jgi:hypothetical protein
VVKPACRREVIRHYQEVFALSERRACRAMGFGRASHRCRSRRDPALELRMRLKGLAESAGALWLQAAACPAPAGGLADQPQADLPALQRRRAVDPDPEPQAPACKPLPIRPGGRRRDERRLGDGLPVGQALRRSAVPDPDNRGLPHERGSRDRREDELPSLPRSSRSSTGSPGKGASRGASGSTTAPSSPGGCSTSGPT